MAKFFSANLESSISERKYVPIPFFPPPPLLSLSLSRARHHSGPGLLSARLVVNAPYEAGLMHSRIATEMRERVTVREEGRHAKEEKNEKEKPRGMPSRKALSWFTFILTLF